MKSKSARWIGLLLLLSFVSVVRAKEGVDESTTPSATQTVKAEPIQFTEETLSNGLHVIYAPLHNAPVVHVRVLYHVGSRDERPDRQGFAHMFEHMMFRGSAHVAPEEHMKRIGEVGGISNAFTSFDDTVYVNTIPSEYMNMALWLEADRMSSFKVSDEIFRTERKVVAEEWRMRHNQPYGDLFEIFLKNAFHVHPYRWTPIGNMDELKMARSSDLQNFFNTYYVPNNATLVIAGDFKPEQAKALVRRYFGWIPRAADPSRAQIKQEPAQTKAREVQVSEAVPLTAITIGYHIPAYSSDDHYALSALVEIMSGGDSGRLEQLLVNNDKPLCVNVQSMHWQPQDQGMFGVSATVLRGKDPQQVEKILVDAVADVVKNGVTPAELDKAKNILKKSLIEGRETAEDLASQLGDAYLFAHDTDRVNTDLGKIESLTPADLQKVAAKYLLPEKSTTLIVKPSILAAADRREASTKATAVQEAPVQPSTAPVTPRLADVPFPKNYPTTAPTATPLPNPKFAKGTESTIDGVKVIVMSDTRLPLVNWSLTMRRGSQSDPKGKEGTAWLTAEMLRRGVEGMSFDQLTRDLDSRAISISVGDNGDNTRLNGSATVDQLDHAIERSRQILLTPTFPADEFAKLKEQSINSLVASQESPTTVARNDLTTALWGDTPLGRYATPQSVKTISLDDVKQFYRTYYRPNGAILVLSGDVTVQQGQELAKKLLSGWKPAAALPEVKIELPERSSQRRIILVDRPEGKQATVRMAIPAYDIHSDEQFACSVANQILTAGIDSRLGKYVRAKKGLAYSVYGVFQPNRQAGAFMGGTDTAIESTADAVEAMFKVFDDMRKANVSDSELAEAKSRVKGSMVMQEQTIDQQAGYRVEGILNGYPIDYYDQYPARVGEVTAKQVRAVVDKYVKEGEMTIVVVAPAAGVQVQLERLGKVQVVPMPAKRTHAAQSAGEKAMKKAA
jgi:zinc protease